MCKQISVAEDARCPQDLSPAHVTSDALPEGARGPDDLWYHRDPKGREFSPVNPASLRLPGSRADGADLMTQKFAAQVIAYVKV